MQQSESHPVLAQQYAHRSVRKFLQADLPDADLNRVLFAAQRASTSSNLQAWSVVVIRDPERKRRISEILGGRDYIEHATVFLVWIADLARDAEVVRSTGTDPETLGLMENTLMCAIDTGIAAQNALLAAEALGYGGVFVGQVRNNPLAIAAELELPKHTFPLFGMALGVPDPAHLAGVKPRLPLSGVRHDEQYDAAAWRDAVAEYEEAYREYFDTQGVAQKSWSDTTAARLGPVSGMHGRHTMRASLASQGFLSN